MTALTFRDTQFDVIDRNGQHWLRGYQVGTALGYSNQPDVAIRKIFDRHSDEFTDGMTALVDLQTAGGIQQTRIFSLRGAHLLGMFARTPVAAEFRKWVLDILDALMAPPKAPSGRVLVTREIERRVLELFVGGWSQANIARQLGLSKPTVNLLLHAKYQFSPAAGSPQCSPELLAAVAAKHLENEQARLIEQQQRLAQRFCNSAHNQPLADQLDRIGRHLQQAAAVALLPLGGKDGEQ